MLMRWVLSSVVVTNFVDGSGMGNFFTYYEAGGLGPSRWAFLELDGDTENQCGGTGGISGYGQSPVTISDQIQKAVCDTNMDAYKFIPGTCDWNDLWFTISNNGKPCQRHMKPVAFFFYSWFFAQSDYSHNFRLDVNFRC